MKIITIVGARPQFVKAAPLCQEVRKTHEEILVHTGQHYDENMSDVFFRELGIPKPDVYLGIGSGPHGAQTGAMLIEIERVLQSKLPDAVIVYGDTNSTLAGALAAAKLNIPVAHVEAGLRSFNREMPEEVNRVLTDHVATWLFAPSQTAAGHLACEGIHAEVYNVGDIMADSVRLFAPRAAQNSQILRRLQLSPKSYCALTIHRPVNTDSRENLINVLTGIQRLRLPIVFPVHPRTRNAIERHRISLSDTALPSGCSPRPGGIIIHEPLGYLDMLQLQQQAAVIVTDSGGIQKEAYYLGVPCVTIRSETEWPETIAAGWNRLVDSSEPEAIVHAVETAITSERHSITEYGDGHAATRISHVLNGRNG